MKNEELKIFIDNVNKDLEKESYMSSSDVLDAVYQHIGIDPLGELLEYGHRVEPDHIYLK